MGTNKIITCDVTALANVNMDYYSVNSGDLKTTGSIYNATLTFSAPEESLNGNTPAYARLGETGVFTEIANSTAGTIPVASKIGYIFNGWYSGSTKVINTDRTIVSSVSNFTDSNGKWLITENKTLTGKLDANNYTVTANAGGGTIPTTTGWTVASGSLTATKPVAYDASYGTLPSPTRVGYRFLGWASVPNEYQQVEYISSSGTQYIDTGVASGNNNLAVQIKYSWNSLPADNTDAAVFGSYSSENHAATRIMNNGNSITYFNLNNRAGTPLRNNFLRTVNTVYEESIVRFGDTVHYKSNDAVFTRNNPTAGTDFSGNIAIFAQNTSGALKSSIKLYYMKIYNGTTLVRDFVPCIRKSDNVVGLYDTVNGTFYTNSGSGTFTAGEVVYVSSNSILKTAANNTLHAQWLDINPPEINLSQQGEVAGFNGWKITGSASIDLTNQILSLPAAGSTATSPYYQVSEHNYTWDFDFLSTTASGTSSAGSYFTSSYYYDTYFNPKVGSNGYSANGQSGAATALNTWTHKNASNYNQGSGIKYFNFSILQYIILSYKTIL